MEAKLKVKFSRIVGPSFSIDLLACLITTLVMLLIIWVGFFYGICVHLAAKVKPARPVAIVLCMFGQSLSTGYTPRTSGTPFGPSFSTEYGIRQKPISSNISNATRGYNIYAKDPLQQQQFLGLWRGGCPEQARPGHRCDGDSHLYELVIVSKIHLQQIIRTDIIWSGCSPFSYIHPLQIFIHIDHIKIEALVDTGADYDAIDGDLAQALIQHNSPSLVSRVSFADMYVEGFTAGVKVTTKAKSTWKISLTGSSTPRGPSSNRDIQVTCYEFFPLSDPIILGMPSIDAYGGLEVADKSVWYADLRPP